MTARSHGWIALRGVVVTDTGLRVGASRDDGDIDLPLLRNGDDRPLIPGDSLGGALRAWSRDVPCSPTTASASNCARSLGHCPGGSSRSITARTYSPVPPTNIGQRPRS